jgi:peptidoglycan/LPS O-acetylase OafA/YrhL
MVLYHWMNYFVSVEANLYRYFRFLTPSFILISGVLVSSVQIRRYGARNRELHKRLFARGLRLLVLFTVLNVLAGVFLARNYRGADLGWAALVRGAFSIYVTGNGKAVFEVLVPIGYFLLLAPALLLTHSAVRGLLHVLTVSTLVATGFAEASGSPSVNLELIAMAMIGLSVGTTSVIRDGTAGKVPLAVLLVAYIGYLGAVSAWDVVFPVRVVGVCLTVLLVYGVALRLGSSGLVQKNVELMGRYSLVAYVTQIVLLQLLRRAIAGLEVNVVLILLLAGIGTWVVVERLDNARRRIPAADYLYRITLS